MFGHRTTRREHTTTTTRTHRDPDRVAGGYKAALRNPNTTSEGRRHAKAELRAMGRGREAHLTLGERIKRFLHIRATPKRERERAQYERRTQTRRTRY